MTLLNNKWSQLVQHLQKTINGTCDIYNASPTIKDIKPIFHISNTPQTPSLSTPNISRTTSTNKHTQTAQSKDFQPVHNTMEKPINTGIHQPEEWEDYKENTGVINPFHDVDQEDTLFHRCASSASITTPLPRSIGSSNYSTTSLSSPSPNFPINSHLNQTNSHLPSPSPTPTPSYKLHDPLLTTISPSHSITSPTQPKTKTNPNPNSNPKTTRIPRLPSRGIPHINPSTQKNWQPILQSYLSYSFLNPDILEEALETPKNGVTSVGTTRRICMDGNAGMAKLGEMVMRLVLREQFYLFSIPHGMSFFSSCSPVPCSCSSFLCVRIYRVGI